MEAINYAMNANPLVAYFGKPASEFTKADIISYIQEMGLPDDFPGHK